ncbi:IclR family transcriptional regulator [Streptomyces sp. NPDC050560]|uniref:IclR family transcriptional regulator n=1 Tax=Streptomyces sp. NPDC050560 TaxID=3365630 RepID=UPI00378F8FAA
MAQPPPGGGARGCPDCTHRATTGGGRDSGHDADTGVPAGRPTLIGSVQRALRLLDAVAAHRDGAPAKQLARETGLALPTAYHLLRTLVHEGYLRRESGVFVLDTASRRLAAAGGRQQRLTGIRQSLARWHETLGVPLYFAVYDEGEIDVVAVADSAGRPAVSEWADFRATAHAHAIGLCLLSQLDDEARRDHIARHPVAPLTRHTVQDTPGLLRRLADIGRMRPVVEHQEYEIGTVCAAVPITAGHTAATLAVSLPVRQSHRLLPIAHRLGAEAPAILGSLDFSISM